MEHLNNRHIGGKTLVLCREVVPILELAIQPHPSIMRLQELQKLNQLSHRHSEWIKIDRMKHLVHFLGTVEPQLSGPHLSGTSIITGHAQLH